MSKTRNYIKSIKNPFRQNIARWGKKVIISFIIVTILTTAAITAFYFYFLKDLPSPTKLNNTTASFSTHIYDRNGKKLYTIYANRNQTFIPLGKIPKTLQQATIAVEDKDFYKHGAVDFRGIIRAFYSTVFQKQLQGGSTLTQQLVKNGLLTPERTLSRKIKELVLSIVVEYMYPKDKILEMYLNQVPYGGTAYGVEAAAQTYFGKHANELTLSQQAYLAGLPEAPSTFSPYGSHPELGKRRQKEILRKMVEQGYITQKQRETAANEELRFQKITNPIKAPHFVFYVKDLLQDKYGEKTVEQGGLNVYTSLDLNLQEFAQLAVASEVAKLKQNKVGNGAALITNPATGEVLAMVGSKDWYDTKDGNMNMTAQHLQPGSSIKPINYAVGLIKGYTAATPFIDQPLCFPSPGTTNYCPRNYDGRFHGVVQMRHALANSLNIPAVEMLKINTLESMIATASAMGITTFKDPSRYGLSLTLGGGEVTMLDMATAFGVFANHGYRVDLHPILKVTDRNGNILEQYNPPKSPIFGKKVFPASVAWIISDILADNNARANAFGTNSELRIGNKFVSVKTGTTNDYKDNWTIGYTPQYVVAVWVGNNDRTPMQGVVSGLTGASPIWNTLMTHMLKDKEPKAPPKPPDIITKAVCATTGYLPSENPEGRCPTRYEYFIKGTEPKTTGPAKTAVWIDKSNGQLAKPGQTENVESKEEIVLTDPLGNKYCLTCPQPTPFPSPNP
jgi:1A family penicillin-binding protein